MTSKALQNQKPIRTPKMLLVKFDGEAARKVTFSDFAEDNAEDAGMLADVRGLKVGESVVEGGGAAPMVTITVLS